MLKLFRLHRVMPELNGEERNEHWIVPRAREKQFRDFLGSSKRGGFQEMKHSPVYGSLLMLWMLIIIRRYLTKPNTASHS